MALSYAINQRWERCHKDKAYECNRAWDRRVDVARSIRTKIRGFKLVHIIIIRDSVSGKKVSMVLCVEQRSCVAGITGQPKPPLIARGGIVL